MASVCCGLLCCSCHSSKTKRQQKGASSLRASACASTGRKIGSLLISREQCHLPIASLHWTGGRLPVCQRKYHHHHHLYSEDKSSPTSFADWQSYSCNHIVQSFPFFSLSFSLMVVLSSQLDNGFPVSRMNSITLCCSNSRLKELLYLVCLAKTWQTKQWRACLLQTGALVHSRWLISRCQLGDWSTAAINQASVCVSVVCVSLSEPVNQSWLITY